MTRSRAALSAQVSLICSSTSMPAGVSMLSRLRLTTMRAALPRATAANSLCSIGPVGAGATGVFADAADATRAVLRATTIAEVIEREARERGAMYYI